MLILLPASLTMGSAAVPRMTSMDARFGRTAARSLIPRQPYLRSFPDFHGAARLSVSALSAPLWVSTRLCGDTVHCVTVVGVAVSSVANTAASQSWPHVLLSRQCVSE